MATRILVVEDDTDVRITLRLLLEDEGYDVIEAADGETAMARLASDHPALVLLDLKLPNMSGFEVCRAMRQAGDIPIIVVTAQVDSYDVVAGLEAGADDYVTKPYVGKELAARIRAALRRVQGLTAGIDRHVHDDLEVRVSEGVVMLRDQPVHLTKTEFLLLATLLDSRGRILSREQLGSLVWGYEYLGDTRLVDVHIRRLRTKIEDDPSNPVHVLTVRGLGYKFSP
jgi:DNA-binding response OmpR family regulator